MQWWSVAWATRQVELGDNDVDWTEDGGGGGDLSPHAADFFVSFTIIIIVDLHVESMTLIIFNSDLKLIKTDYDEASYLVVSGS